MTTLRPTFLGKGVCATPQETTYLKTFTQNASGGIFDASKFACSGSNHRKIKETTYFLGIISTVIYGILVYF